MQQQTKEQTIVNGINTAEIFGTIDAIQEQPALARFEFRARNRWTRGGNNRTLVNDFHGAGAEHNRKSPFILEKDEPPVLLGTDRGANPVEYALAALAGCLTTTLVFHAAAQGVQIEEIESELSGDTDVRGFLGLDETIRNGLEKIRVTFKIKADAPREKLQELVELAQNRSGVFDMMTNRVPVSVELAA